MVPEHSGLLPLKPDRKDFSSKVVFGSGNLSDLPPQGMGRKPIAIKNQKSTQFCTGYGTSSASEYQEGIELSPEYQVAKISQLSGSPITGGADPKTAMKATIAFGSLPQSESSLSLESNGDSVADWRKWEATLDDKARKHQKSSFFRVDYPYDVFDSIRMALWLGKEEKQVVLAFGKWFSAWNNPSRGIIPNICDRIIGYHNYLFIDWKEINGIQYLVIQNSYGEGFGDGGLQYLSRETTNEAFKDIWKDGTGLYQFRDVDPNSIKSLQIQRMALTEILVELYQRLLWKLRYGLFN